MRQNDKKKREVWGNFRELPSNLETGTASVIVKRLNELAAELHEKGVLPKTTIVFKTDSDPFTDPLSAYTEGIRVEKWK